MKLVYEPAPSDTNVNVVSESQPRLLGVELEGFTDTMKLIENLRTYITFGIESAGSAFTPEVSEAITLKREIAQEISRGFVKHEAPYSYRVTTQASAPTFKSLVNFILN
jgi:hypothetical protein